MIGSVVAVLAWCVATHGITASTRQGDHPPSAAHFTISIGGTIVGREDVVFAESPEGWKISSSGRQVLPATLVLNSFAVNYTRDWQPRTSSIEGTLQSQPFTRSTTFATGSATTDLVQGGQKTTVARAVSAHAIVLPNNVFAAYEALAAQLSDAKPGATFAVYIEPQAEITAALVRVTPRVLQTPSGSLDLRQCDLAFSNPSGPLGVEVWIDASGRLAKVAIPAAMLLVVRADLSTVMARVESMRNPGDEYLFIPALGFTLAATITRPSGVAQAGSLPPVIILVGGSGSADRDEIAAGIPIFGQLAGALADAGFFVIRYDKRGIGQSGGRVESATLADYADDVNDIVRWVKLRKDVDATRLAIAGYAEGGAVAMLEAAGTKNVAAVVLIGAAGLTGREITMRQQQHTLAGLNEPEATKQAKVALEQQILNAVVSGTGWDGIPADVRRQSDVPSFRSWLLFDPAAVMPKVSQPILVVAGALDMQVFPESADRLEQLGRARKNAPASFTRKIVVPGINHLLVTAATGELDEYGVLPSRTISPDITSAVATWLAQTLPARKK